MKNIPGYAVTVKDADGDIWVCVTPQGVHPRRWTMQVHTNRTDLPCPTTEQLNAFGPFEILTRR